MTFQFIPEFARVYLAVFFTFVAVFYTFRIITKKQRHSLDTVFPGPRFSASWWNHLAFRFFRAAIWMVCLLRWPFPGIDAYLGILPGLNVAPVVSTGLLLLTSGFALAISVHFHLGRHWRSGIDPDGPASLRTDGLYRFTRNPMFVGVAAAQLGFFLSLPSVFTGLCLIIGLYTLHRQILAEEEHLEGAFPDHYPVYKRHVRRWL
ncbi:isoprenylcysteine carboxylmethyltransferase family protein [Proteobacteria bacterium 005FR1]|nr:isoprenylcysteine carboxylmethyltransferase family protein [Proteobacteria bacterium 005FR1]